MKLGYFTMPFHALERPFIDTLAEDRDAVILADRLGFCEAFIGEHITDPFETVSSSLTFIASVAYETREIKLGTGTVNLPNNHPAQIAATAAMVDHMLAGRFILGISTGALATDWEVFETLDRDRGAMFVEAIEHILAIWRGEAPYNLTGRYWNISTERSMDSAIHAGVMRKPYQRPHPEIVCTAISPFSQGIAAAAKRGWHPISSNFLQPPFLRTHWTKYVEGCEAASIEPDWRDWRIARMIFVADDAATAGVYAKSTDGPYGQCMRHIRYKLGKANRLGTFKWDADQPDDELTLEYLMDKLVIAGTPDSVSEQILALREECGPFGTLIYVGLDWQDAELSRRSMTLLAERVMPKVNAALSAEVSC